MSKTEHTKEPWMVEDECGELTVFGADGQFVMSSDPTSEEQHNTIYRIAACVNACAGINPEAVPDLLAACRAYLAVCPCTGETCKLCIKAGAAIAKATKVSP